MSVSRKKWIVGMDLRPRSQGAMRWAAWLDGNSKAGGEHLVGIHVLEEDHLRVALRYHHLEELTTGAREAATQTLVDIDAASAFDEFHILQGGTAEKSLCAAASYHHAHGLILGRQALREGHYVSRLGRVARRILRELPAPVIVVPPDVEPPLAADAPILAACDLHENSLPGVRFAADMAERLGRPLVLVYVVPLPDDYGARIISEESLAKLRQDHQTEGETELRAWAKAFDIDARCVVLQGGVVESLVRAADQHQAAMLVTGSRRLSNFDRLFLTSIGSETCSASRCAVVVVPPEA